MAEDITLSLIFPAFNESETILNTVKEAIAYFDQQKISFEIIVVADGTDATRDKVKEFSTTEPRVRSMGSSERRGKGFGVREGVLAAKGQYVGFADADNKTPIGEFSKVYLELLRGARIVIGSRKMKSSQVEVPQARYRRVGSLVFNRSVNLLLGLGNINDTQCGFKFFEGGLAKELFQNLKTAGYMFDVEILRKAVQQKIPIQQVPVRWRDDGDSRLNLVSGNLKNLRDILRIRLG